MAGLKDPSILVTPSARLLHDWIEHDTFTWLVTSDILDEYTEVLARLGVRRSVIGRIVNLLRTEAEFIETTRTVAAEPDPGDAPFWTCADLGSADFIVTLNTKDFPQNRLSAKVIATVVESRVPAGVAPPASPAQRPNPTLSPVVRTTIRA